MDAAEILLASLEMYLVEMLMLIGDVGGEFPLSYLDVLSNTTVS